MDLKHSLDGEFEILPDTDEKLSSKMRIYIRSL